MNLASVGIRVFGLRDQHAALTATFGFCALAVAGYLKQKAIGLRIIVARVISGVITFE